MTVALVGVIGALIAALAAAFVSNMSVRRLNQRNDRLARINRQLSEFYGPMLATLEANRRAYKVLVEVHSVGSPAFFRGDARPATDEELELWRLWVTVVFQPGLRRVSALIFDKADLLIESNMPDCLMDFCAHTASMEVVIARWASGDFSAHEASIPRPGRALDEYVVGSFAALKAEQERLLALTGKETIDSIISHGGAVSTR